ncbi:hypothetical protein [Streptomyces abikoensis]
MDQIVIDRWDSGTADWNQGVANDLWGETSSYRHATGAEVLPCPGCGNHQNLIVEGCWDDPLTVLCPCGDVLTTDPDRSWSPANDWGRNVLKRLILNAADPTYEARRLRPRVVECHERERLLWSSPLGCYRMDPEDFELAVAVDLDASDLGAALTRALKPALPERHGGLPLTLVLLHVALALRDPLVRDSEDGQRLQDAVREALGDFRTWGAQGVAR